MLRQNFDETNRDREVVLLISDSLPQLSNLERRQERTVARQDAEVPLRAGQLDFIHLLGD